LLNEKQENMSIFDNQFYPTPKAVIETMTATLDLHGKHVLEPSAGKGDIVDFCANLGANVSVCEVEPTLAKIVAAKGKFLKPDFLNLNSDEVSHIDFIIMNPPFFNADAHILHAWDIAPDGCEIIALCNWNTLDNRFSRMRSRLGSLIDAYGYSENLGDCFWQSERKTGVEVGLVKLFKPAKVDDFGAFFSYEDEHEEQFDGVMQYNVVRDVVNRYVEACKLFAAVAQNAVAMNNLVGTLGAEKVTFTLKEDDKEKSIEDFKIELRKKCWSWVFSQLKMEKYMTQSLKEQINKFVEKQQNVPFTMGNIYKMLEMVVNTNGNRMNSVLVEVFDRLTDHYHENRYHVEGWKTNSAYMVNKKFILGHISEIGWSGEAKVRYPESRRSCNTTLINDLMKALCFLTATKYESEKHDLYQFFNYKFTYEEDGKVRMSAYNRPEYDKRQFGVWYDWGWLRIKVYKKGSMHAEFKDLKVWEMFNRAVGNAKGWQLPEKL
jgi:hypothetical protein